MRTECQIMLDVAKSALGTPYKWGGSSLSQGIDCSGLVRECLLSAIGGWPVEDMTAASMFVHPIMTGRKVIHKPENPLIPGTLLFFGKSEKAITHVALAYGPHHYIEAAGTNDEAQVRVRPLGYRKDIVGRIELFKGESW